MSSEPIAIAVEGLRKRYEVYAKPRDRLWQSIVPALWRQAQRLLRALGSTRTLQAPRFFREFWALDGVSFELRRGETLGVIGRNGSGKSTLLQILAGTLAPTEGSCRVEGRVAALLELGSGFNPEFTGRENVFLNGRILGLTHRQIAARYDEIVAFADIGEFIDQPIKTYSTGMFVRLAFAVQAHIDASVIIIDEALAVGDVFFRQKCYARLEKLRAGGAAILLVSHSMPEIEQFCAKALLLENGVPRFLGPAAEATKHYYLLDQRGKAIPVPQPAPAHPASGPDAQAARPPADAYFDIAAVAQASNGAGHCTGVALCDAAGRASRSFRQGETAHFTYEFELAAPIGVPICGLVISNDKGVIVHGKNSWQFPDPVPQSGGAGTRIVCHHEITLSIAPGEYVFEIGLTSIAPEQWRDRDAIAQDAFAASHVRICHVANAGRFTVGLALRGAIPVLLHHGVADLPGHMRVTTLPH